MITYYQYLHNRGRSSITQSDAFPFNAELIFQLKDGINFLVNWKDNKKRTRDVHLRVNL